MQFKKSYYAVGSFMILLLVGFGFYYIFFYDNEEVGSDLHFSTMEDRSDESVVIYISGAVETPGIYRLPPGSRIVDAVGASGNLLPYADLDAVNMAASLSDGEHIIIPYNFAPPEEELGIRYVNVNTATVHDLEDLPGVGRATAEKIIEYRKTNGLFKDIGEIKNIRGIGEGKFQNMRRHLTI